MSKRERQDTTIWETRMAVFAREGWQCCYVDKNGERCPKQATQAAHILPQDVLHLARYGPVVIHSIHNLRGTCPKHNATVQINYRSRPREADEHAANVRALIEEETHAE
jgi:hypothetical protein